MRLNILYLRGENTLRSDPPVPAMIQRLPTRLRLVVHEVFRGGTEFRVAVEILYRILLGEKIYYRDLTASYRIVVAKLRRLGVLELIKDVDCRRSYLRVSQHFLL